MTNQSDKNLKMWLKMEEGTGTTLNDVLKTNNGTLAGSGATWLAGGRPARDGKYCIAFDGTANNSITVENSNGEVWNGSSSFTVSMWFLRTGNNSATSAQLGFCHSGAATNNRIYINLGASGPSLNFTVGSTGFATTTISNGVWYHAAVSHDAVSGISYAYFNGKLVASSSTALGTGTYDIFIGALSASTNQVMNGYVDDVRFYNKFMTEQEIKTIVHGFGYAK